MLRALQTVDINEDVDTPKRVYGSSNGLKEFLEKELDFFVNSRSFRFFERFGLNVEFLARECSTWSTNKSFIESRKKVLNIKVVNDCAERAVSLTKEYVNILSNDENQKQYLIQVVEEFRKQYTDANKGTIVKKLKTN